MRRARQVAVKMLLWAVCHVAKSNKEKRKKRGTNSMKNLWKKAQKIFMCTLMLAMIFNIGVSAAGEGYLTATYEENGTKEVVRFTEGTIKEGESAPTCSLHIYKYSYNTVNTGSAGTALPSTPPAGAKELKDINFKYHKVANLVTDKSNGTTSLKYQWCTDAISSKIKKELNLEEKDSYTSNYLNEKLLAAESKSVEKAFRDVQSVITGENGSAVRTGIEQGLYLVVEYSPTDKIAVKTTPFFVSLPMTNVVAVTLDDGTEKPAGSLWQYDVYTYPKNVEEVPDIEKNVQNDTTNREEKYTSASVGDLVEFVLRMPIPQNIDNMSAFTVVDTMSQGLTFAGKEYIAMEIVGENGEKIKLSEEPELELEPVLDEEEWKSYIGEKTLTWRFIERTIKEDEDGYKYAKIEKNYLEKLGGKELVIRYKAILNENCVVAGTGNPNSVELKYNHNNRLDQLETDPKVPHEPKSRVYTFGIEVTKVDGGDNGLGGVEFELYKDNDKGEKEKIILKKQKYRTDIPEENQNLSTAENQYCIDQSATPEDAPITTDKEGKAYIWGLKPGTYYLKETKTKDDKYILLKELIPVTIEEDPNLQPLTTEETTGGKYAGEKGTYLANANGTYYKLLAGNYKKLEVDNKKNYNFGSHKIYENADGTGSLEGELLYAKVQAKANEEEGFSCDNGSVRLKVVNNEKFAVPQTGGIGTWMFTICGAVIVVAAIGLILIRRKKSMLK